MGYAGVFARGEPMTDAPVVVDQEPLRQFVSAVFASAGMVADQAGAVAANLVWANLRGVDSHGVLRIPMYLERIDNGAMNKNADVRIVREAGAAAVLEGDRAAGAVAMTAAMKYAIERARQTTIGAAWVKNSTHSGALAYYAMMALDAGMAALVMNATRPLMAAHGGHTPMLGTSPLCLAVPGGDSPLILDMAASSIALGSIMRARATGEALPEGTALDSAGQATTEAAEAQTILPMAGPKGSGLALMIEALTSLILANPLLEGEMGKSAATGDMKQNALCLAIDVAQIADIDEVRGHVAGLIAALKAQPRAGDVAEILMPGEGSDRTWRERAQNGIPIPAKTWAALGEVAERFGLEMPAEK